MGFFSDLKHNAAPLSLILAHLISFSINIYIYNYLKSLQAQGQMIPEWKDLSNAMQTSLILSLLMVIFMTVLILKYKVLSGSYYFQSTKMVGAFTKSKGFPQYLHTIDNLGSGSYIILSLVTLSLLFSKKIDVVKAMKIYIALITLSGINLLTTGYIYFQKRPDADINREFREQLAAGMYDNPRKSTIDLYEGEEEDVSYDTDEE